MGIKIFRRDPAAVSAALAGVLKLVCAFWWHVTVTEQAAVNTALAASVALVVAVMAHDSAGAAALGLLQAAMAAAVGFGLHWSPNLQAVVLTAATAILAMWTRTQVTAKLAPRPVVVVPHPGPPAEIRSAT